jgi:hypothetical protein
MTIFYSDISGSLKTTLPPTTQLSSKSKLCYDQWSFSQSVLVSSPQLGPKTRFLLLLVVALLMWGTHSGERMGLLFAIAAGPCQRSHSWVLVPCDSGPYFTVSDSRLPQPGGPFPHIYILQEQVVSVITPGTEFTFHCLL